MGNDKKQNGYKKLVNALRKERVDTWFDMGIFLDRIKDNQKEFEVPKNFTAFKKNVGKGIGFISFDFGVDGVSIEVAKYGRALERLYFNEFDKRPNICCIGGHLSKETGTIFDSAWSKVVLRSARGFDAWDGYMEYFHTKLARGSKEYNALAKKVWDGAVDKTLELARIVCDNDLNLLIPVNVNSNPGNVALSLAIVLVSEYMDIPVLASHHDFYWEDGKKPGDRKSGEKPGLRDHFFTNSHIGEVNALIELLYPWNSNRWFHTVINSLQKETLTSRFGISPVAIKRIPTAIDLRKYRRRDENERSNILKRLKYIFSSGEEQLLSKSIFDVPEECSYLANSGKAHFYGNKDGIEARFQRANLLMLQPTRIIKRKRIELSFKFLEKMLSHSAFSNFFRTHSHLSITLLITGPIAIGHNNYFHKVMKDFKSFLETIPEEFRDRIFLGLAFGLENKTILEEKKLDSLTIEELYSVSNLVVLPSQTEGRGLPIIESCASEVPILCHRYEPEYVYSDVIGEKLEAEKRLNVLEFSGDDFSDELVNRVCELTIDPEELEEFIQHNRDVIKRRYSMGVLEKSFEQSLYGLWYGAKPDSKVITAVKDALKANKSNTKYGKKFHQLVLNENRKYIPGMTQLEFMVYLKSLIDPSFFRVEEVELRSRVFDFSERLFELYLKGKKDAKDTSEKKIAFYKHLLELFAYHRKTDPLAIDHSLSYRHRNRRHYPYRKLTEQELYGVVGILFRKIFSKDLELTIKSSPIGHFADLRSAVLQFAGKKGQKIVINDSERLLNDLTAQREFALFAGHYYEQEIKIFVLNVMKERLGHSLDYELTKDDLKSEKIEGVAPISFFVREEPLNDVTYAAFMKWLKRSAHSEIKLLYDVGLFKVIKAKNYARGIHLAQLGDEAIDELLRIKKNNGFIVATSNSSFMLDMIDIPCYHVGQVKTVLLANFMDLKMDDTYILWVPAGLKSSLAYPTPIQTPREFSNVLNSELFDECIRKYGEEEVLVKLRKDADEFGNPIKVVLEHMLAEGKSDESPIFSSTINGIHDDDLPWSGAMVKVPMKRVNVKYNIALSGHTAKPVVDLINHFESDSGKKVAFGWNGGYILNNELVGKLGLPEDYIGSPLGFLCANNDIAALPLYNKSAILFDKSGKVRMERINLKKGLHVEFASGAELDLSGKQLNVEKGKGAIYYDLLYPRDKEYAYKDRVLYRFAGNKVIEVIREPSDPVPVIPVGLVISLPVEEALKVEAGEEVKFSVRGLEDVVDAIEAGPMLVENSKEAIDMEAEGWKTENSIATQAARLDYTDMRGPKMAAGITKDGDLVLLAINGRIRESVGATHIDAAEILIKQGCVTGMGFDPGGSVTLVVDGKQLNISPYNKDYEQNIYSLPPQARFVGNAILGTLE